MVAAFVVSLMIIVSEIQTVQLLKAKTQQLKCQDVFVINTADVAEPNALHNNLKIQARAVPYGFPCPRPLSSSKKGGQTTTNDLMPKSLLRQELLIGAASQTHLKIIRGTGLVLSYSEFYGSRHEGEDVCNFTGNTLLSNHRRQTVVVCNPYQQYKSTNCSCYVALSLKYFSPKRRCVNVVVSNQLTPTNSSSEARSQATLIAQAFTAVGKVKCGPKNRAKHLHYYETVYTIEPGTSLVLKVNEIGPMKFFYKDSVDRNGLPYAGVCCSVVPKSVIRSDNGAKRHFLIAKMRSNNMKFSPEDFSKYQSHCPMTFDRREVDFDPMSRKCVQLLLRNMGPSSKHDMQVILPKSYLCYDNLQYAGFDMENAVKNTTFATIPLKTGHAIFVQALLMQPVVVLFKWSTENSSTTCYETVNLAPFANLGRRSFVDITCSNKKRDSFRCRCYVTVTS